MRRLTMPAAERMGVAAVVAQAADEPVLLVRHGRAVAVVNAAEHLEAGKQLMRSAALAVLDAAAGKSSAGGATFDLDTVCSRLGLDAGAVRDRATKLAEEASARKNRRPRPR